MISDERAITNTLNQHFFDITKILDVKPTETETMGLTLSEIRDRYEDPQSIVKIQSQMSGVKNLFSFKPVTFDKTIKTITSLKKAQRTSPSHCSS